MGANGDAEGINLNNANQPFLPLNSHFCLSLVATDGPAWSEGRTSKSNWSRKCSGTIY